MSNLPLEAAVWREDRPNWSQQDELLARLIENVDYWGRQQAVLTNPKIRSKLPKPERVQHPDRHNRPATRPEVTTDPGAIARFFGISKGGA